MSLHNKILMMWRCGIMATQCTERALCYMQGTYPLHLQGWIVSQAELTLLAAGFTHSLRFGCEDGSNIFLRNVS
jgi:hypothetical protein